MRSTLGIIVRHAARATVALAASACGADDAPRGTPAPDPDPAPQQCPFGSLEGPSGACMPVGIQGCDALFLGEDQLCRPSLAACPPGQIPRFEGGCIEVGIPRCAPEFVEEDGLCHPTMTKCPPGTFAVPQEGCVPVDGPDGCGSGTWGALADAPGTVYVDPGGAGVDGDGSREKPFTTIAAAMSRVEDGGRVALAAGDYREEVTIARAIELVGRCPSMVRLLGSPSRQAAIVIDATPSATLRAIAIADAYGGIRATSGAHVAIDRVHVEAKFFGVSVEDHDTTVSLTHSLVSGTPYDDDPFGLAGLMAGVYATNGGGLTMSASAVVGSETAGIQLQDGASAEVNDSLIEGAGPANPAASGTGAEVWFAGSLVIGDSAVVGTTQFGLLAAGRRCALRASGVLVAGTKPARASPYSDAGAEAAIGATVELDATVVLGANQFGVIASGSGSSATVSRSLVRETARGTSAYRGGAVWADQGAHLVVTGTTVFRNSSVGLMLRGDGSSLEATGNLVEGTIPSTDFPSGDAVPLGPGVSIEGGQATLSSNAIVGNSVTGVEISHGADVTATGNLIDDTLPADNGLFGIGLQLFDDAKLAMTSNVVSRSRSVGVIMSASVDGTPKVTLHGDLVRDTMGQPDDGAAGIGIFAGGADLTVVSSIVRNSRTAGVFCMGGATTIDQSHIDGVPGGRFILTNPTETFDDVGDGVLAIEGAKVDITKSTVSGCARAGALYSDAAGNLAGVDIVGNRFGLVVMGHPTPTVGPDCTFADNAETDSVVSGELPVPSGPPPLP